MNCAECRNKGSCMVVIFWCVFRNNPQAYSMVTTLPKSTRRDEIAPQPKQFVPQPSITDSQDLLNELTARVSAPACVSHGDQALNPINMIKIARAGIFFRIRLPPCT